MFLKPGNYPLKSFLTGHAEKFFTKLAKVI